MPAWSSDMNLLAQVVKLHYNEVRSNYFNLKPSESARMNSVSRPHPITFSWASWDEISSTENNNNINNQVVEKSKKLKRLEQESEEMMVVIEKLTIEGRLRKQQL